MSKKKARLLPLYMLLLVMSGAVMPQAVSMLQDHLLNSQTDSRALDGIQLSMRGNGEITSVLALLSGGYTRIELRDGTKLTEKDAIAAATEFLALLKQEKRLPEFALREETAATSFVAISDNDGTDSAVIWECEFWGQAPLSCMVRIDDATGTPVSINFASDIRTTTSYMDPSEKTTVKGAWDQAAYVERSAEELLREAWLWADFLQRYYGLDTAEVTDLDAKGKGGYYMLTFANTAEENIASCQSVLALQPDNISFNW